MSSHPSNPAPSAASPTTPATPPAPGPSHRTACDHEIAFGTHAAADGDAAGGLAVRLRAVTKTFGSGANAVHALRGIDLDVAPGRLVMLVGPSGCGKTTLVSIISGVLDSDGGSAEVFGVDWNVLNTDQRARRRQELVGFVFQQFNLIPTLNIAENVSVPLLIRGMKEKDALERAADALRRVGLGERTRSLPGQLSGGQQQRVAIARAVVAMPRLIVCDEPTASLDAKRGQDVLEIIHEASRTTDASNQPRCVIVVTHDSRIFHYADQIIEMDDGRLKATVSKHIMDEAVIVPHYDDETGGPAAPAPTAPTRAPGQHGASTTARPAPPRPT